jgi:cytidine kinase
MDFIAFGLILDDLLFPDGSAAMGVLGGGGPQTAFGMRLWAASVGVVAEVGPDLPEAALDWFRDSNVDSAGLHFSAQPTLRAWQVIQSDGSRRHVWRTDPPASKAQLGRAIQRIPEAYRGAKGFHFGLHPDDPDLEFAAELRQLGGVVSIELFRPAAQRLSPDALQSLLACADIFSLNLAEANSLVGPDQLLGLAKRLVSAGAGVLALRLGKHGSIVAEGQVGRVAHIPAFPVSAPQEVGAGNAYCGGFLVGWVETHNLVTAGLQGAVSASFILEQVGVPVVGSETRAEARERLRALQPRVELLANGR